MSKKTIYIAIFIMIIIFSACSRQKNNNEENFNKDDFNEDNFNEEINFNNEDDFDAEINFYGDGIIITRYTGERINVMIPQYIQDLPVASIRERAFYDKKLTSVTIPESVTLIGEYAFARNRLTNIIIPRNAIQVRRYAFAENQLTSIILPDSMSVIEDGVFYKNQLKNVVLPSSIRYIRGSAFAINQLTDVVFPDGLYSIGKNAFADNQLTNVIIPDSTSSIDEEAFARNNLTSVTIPYSVFTIDKFAFSSNQLININISEKIEIDALAFDNGFADFYLGNGGKAGNYTYVRGNWNVIFTESPAIDIVTDGIYKITAAYSHLYNHVFSGDSVREIETEKLGLLVTINNNEAIFDGIEYQIYEGNDFSSNTKDNLLEYEYFLHMFAGMNYGSFDENIIGKEYTGKVKAMTMRNNDNSYYVFFADNKLIIMISAEKGEDTETEFNHLIISRYDSFFYIAERIIE